MLPYPGPVRRPLHRQTSSDRPLVRGDVPEGVARWSRRSEEAWTARCAFVAGDGTHCPGVLGTYVPRIGTTASPSGFCERLFAHQRPGDRLPDGFLHDRRRYRPEDAGYYTFFAHKGNRYQLPPPRRDLPEALARLAGQKRAVVGSVPVPPCVVVCPDCGVRMRVEPPPV